MEAIILAGGLGTRLRTMHPKVPKPMVPVWNKPFLAHLLDYLKTQGITAVILSVSYLSEQIEAYFKNSYQGIRIRYAREEQPLGTGGAIRNALQLVQSSDSLFIINGDTYLKLDYPAMAQQHEQQEAKITMALHPVLNCHRYGAVHIENTVVLAFQERGKKHPGLINAGVYYFDPCIFQQIDIPTAFSFEKDFLVPQVSQLKPAAFIVSEYFIDIGIPEDYAQILRDFTPHSVVT